MRMSTLIIFCSHLGIVLEIPDTTCIACKNGKKKKKINTVVIRDQML